MIEAKTQGFDRLRQRLRAMPAPVKEAIGGALEKNADELVAMQTRLAPVDDGILRDSIEANPASGAGRTGVKAEFGLAIHVTAGGGDAFYARWVEFGTRSGKPARPFFFPAYRALRRRMKSRVSRAQNRAIKRMFER